jgi:hypothetical protein
MVITMRIRSFLALGVAVNIVGCTSQPDMGSPVGIWKLHGTSVTFNADGTVTRNDEGNAPDPDFLAPLRTGQPGRWSVTGSRLTLTATRQDGTEAKEEYEYSVGTDGQGKPALHIAITSGPHKNSGYALARQ